MEKRGKSDIVHEFLKGGFSVSSNGQPERMEDAEEIELSLGLSLNGRFGVDPERKKMRRSSSIANMGFASDSGLASPLMRACSLPAETAAEEVQRRKEVQWRRRMEARKKRMEKLKNVKHLVLETRNEIAGGVPGSSGIPGNQSQSIDGTKTDIQVADEMEPAGYEVVKKAMLEMPYVSMKGDGENVNKMDGLLCRYNKGEEVRIMCMCHGYVLSPADFVKHGGGGDVDNPLKHIIVTPRSPHLDTNFNRV